MSAPDRTLHLPPKRRKKGGVGAATRLRNVERVPDRPPPPESGATWGGTRGRRSRRPA